MQLRFKKVETLLSDAFNDPSLSHTYPGCPAMFQINHSLPRPTLFA